MGENDVVIAIADNCKINFNLPAKLKMKYGHINENEDLKDLSKVTINLISEKICRENFAGKNIWSTNEENGFSMAMVKMKRRGIEFQGLSSNMQLQLEEFISSLIKK